MSEKLSFNAKWELEKIEKSTAALRAEMVRLETALDDSTGVIQKLKPYPLHRVIISTSPASHGTPEAAEKAAEKAYTESLPVVGENAAIVAANIQIKDRLLQLITNAGIPKTIQVRKPRSRRSWETIPADAVWFDSLCQHIPLYDGWPELERRYQEWIRLCKEWRQRLDAEADAKKRAEEKKEAEFSREVTRRELVNRYGLDKDAPIEDIRSHLLSRNKYLRLAHYLQENRNDWTDGPYYAQTGLDSFKIEDERDSSVFQEIHGLCSDWDGDGRVFRDCTWNYGVLFSIASEQDPNLITDYNRLASLV